MLKPTAKALIESFRYRRLAYLPKNGAFCLHGDSLDQREVVSWGMLDDRRNVGHELARRIQIEALPYRQHLASLNHSTSQEGV